MRKAIWTISILFIGLLVTLAWQNRVYSSDPKPLVALCDTAGIGEDLRAIVNTPAPRQYLHVDVLDSVAEYIGRSFEKSTNRVWSQPYKAAGRNYSNVIASFGPMEGPRIIVGAHYDVCGNQDGADDNGSGTAGLLALGRLLKGKTLPYRIDLVAYSTEEPPFFDTENMGSYVHAKSLHDSSVEVKGMVCLEMIGYYNGAENSQDYPVGFMRSIYGDKGDFITIVRKAVHGDFASRFRDAYFRSNSIPARAFTAPSFLGGIDLSDHRNYWEFGYDAVMVTNTAFFRNKEYHLQGDSLGRLDPVRVGLVMDGVYRTLMDIK